MIFRKFSFFVLFSIALIFTLFVPDILWLLIFLVCLALIMAGFGISLVTQDLCIKFKQIGLLLIACALGIAFGFSLSARVRLYRNKGFTGIKTTEITSFTGTCIKDSVPGKKEEFTHYLNLVSVGSEVLGVFASARGTVMVISKNGKRLYTGETITINGTLTPVDSRPDVHFMCWANGKNIMQTGYSRVVYKVRQDIHCALVSLINGMGFPASSLFKALFLGIREDLPHSLYEGFEKTGTLHILALSGLHVGIIYSFLSLLLFFLPGRRIKYFAGFSVVLFYLFLVGPRPSLTRATVMLIIFGIGYLLSAEREPLNLLSIACTLILVVDPVSAYSLSFQLSFLALTGIILIGRPLAGFIRPYLPDIIALPLSMSIGAQVGTAPIVFIYFGKIYPSGILVTLLLIPLVTIFLLGGIIFLLLSIVPLALVSECGEIFFSFIYRFMYSIISFFKNIPGISLAWEWWHWFIFLMIFVPFLCNIRIMANAITKKVMINRKV